MYSSERATIKALFTVLLYPRKTTLLIVFFTFYLQDRTNIIIVVEPVGLVGNREYAAAAAGGLKAVGNHAVNSF